LSSSTSAQASTIHSANGVVAGWLPDRVPPTYFINREEPVPEPPPDEPDIWVMDADGGNAHKLWAGPYSEPWGLDWAAASD
jgi:hypothetical protein